MNEALITSEVGTIIGFRQDTTTDAVVLDSANLTTDSGLVYQDAHPIVTLTNIEDSQEDASISAAEMNTYLANLKNDVINDVSKQIVRDEIKFIEQNSLFKYEQSFTETETLGTGFVGIKIEPNHNENILLTINSISVSFNGAAVIPIKLIHSESGTIVSTTNITSVDKEQVRTRTNLRISLNTGNIGGSYYLGYFTSEVALSPYKRVHEFASVYSTPKCFNTEFGTWSLTGSRIDITDPIIEIEPFGLNISYHAETDYTQLIIENKYRITEAIMLKFAERVVELVLNSTRSNIKTRELDEQTRNLANLALDNPTSGIRGRLAAEIKSLKKMFFPKPLVMKGTLR